MHRAGDTGTAAPSVADAALLTVTIIAAVHRPGRFLAKFLHQLERTTDEGIDVILVDDCSEDGTAELMQEWCDGDGRFTLLCNTTTLGVARSRNLAVAQARGDYLWFVDHDDTWEPDIVRRMRAEAAHSGADLIVCRADYRSEDGGPSRMVDGLDEHSTVSAATALSLMLHGRLHGFLWSKLIRREVLGPSPFPPLPLMSDTAGVAGAISRARTIAFIPDVLYHCVHHAESISKSGGLSLSSVASAYEAVRAAALTLGGPAAESELLAYFTAWFYCRALVLTPIRRRAEPRIQRDAVRLAHKASRALPLAPVRSHSRRTWMLLCVIRYTPPVLCLAVVRSAYGLRGIASAVRTPRRAPVPAL